MKNEIIKDVALLIGFIALLAVAFKLGRDGREENTPETYYYHTYVDSETGVNYIWVNSDGGITMVPRYNADGTLYISE